MLAPSPGTVLTVEVAWGADVRLLRCNTVASLDDVVRLTCDDSLAGTDLGPGDQVLLRWNTSDGTCAAWAVLRSISQATTPSLVVELPNTGPERRVRTRASGQWPCVCAVDSATAAKGTIVDIGIGGAKLLTDLGDVALGQRLAIRTEQATVSGRVVSLFVSSDGPAEMRVRFEDLGLEDLIAIGEMLGDPFPRPKHPVH